MPAPGARALAAHRKRRLAFAALLLALAPRAAAAHHVVSEYGIAFPVPVTVAELDYQIAGFDLAAGRGTWETLTPSLELALAGRLSLSARLPMAHIDFDDRLAVSGLGDAELGVKVRVYASPHGGFMLSAGLGSEAPTGNAHNGIGNGHWELVPFVAASGQLGKRLVLYGLVSDRRSLANNETGVAFHTHGVISPHTEHELANRLAAALVLGPAYASVGGDLIVPLVGSDGPSTVARFEAGVVPAARWRVAAGLDLPATGPERFTWRARLGLARQF